MSDLGGSRSTAATAAMPAESERLSTTPPEPARPPVLSGLELLRWGWRQLTSMRTALVLLFLLALAAVPGSLVPQEGVNPGRVVQFRAEHPTVGGLYDRLGLFHVYSAPWFAAVYLLLFLSLAGCVVPRTRLHWQAMRARPPAAPRNLARLPVVLRWETDASPAAVLAAAGTSLRRRRFRLRCDPGAVSAEKGHLRETGNLAFHASLILLLAGVAVGSLWGFKGDVVVPEGQGFSNARSQYDSFSQGTQFRDTSLAPFTVTLEKLTVRYQVGGQQQGAPRDFHAEVSYTTDPSAARRRYDLRVNHPLEVGGTRVYLTGNGYAPRVTVRDGRGQVAFSGAVPFLPADATMRSTGVVKVPDARPSPLGLTGFFLPTAAIDPARGPISLFPDTLDPRLILTAYKGDLGMDAGRAPQSVYRLDTTGMTQLRLPGGDLAKSLRVGDTLTLPDGLGSLTFDGIERYANFQVAHDPGKGFALAGAGAAFGGLMLSLFVRRRRVWVRASAGPAGRTVVEVAALARAETSGLAEEAGAVADEVRLAASPLHPPRPQRPAEEE